MDAAQILETALMTRIAISLLFIIILWLFIYSAVKQGVKSAIKDILPYIDSYKNQKHITPEEDLKAEMEGWN